MVSSAESAAALSPVAANGIFSRAFKVRAPVAVALACVCALVGLLAVYPVVHALLAMWQEDDLRSMGLLVPFISFALVLRSWRQTGWRAEGSWWGFALLALIAALVFLHERTLLLVLVNRTWLIDFLPKSLVAVAYAASMVLLFGGGRLLRAAWFGVLFMGMVIPVPHLFSHFVDLPLQHASATVARGFAHMLGQQLTQDNLRLMFTPTFGMFIAPGCNGIRGAVTLGLAALVVSYVYRFRPLLYLPVVAGAVLLGYLFNFVRLCLLVVYYVVALSHPWLQLRGTNVDYLIGATLFVLALLIFFTVANRLRNDPRDVVPAQAPAEPVEGTPLVPLLCRALAVFGLAAVFGTSAYHAYEEQAMARSAASHMPELPQQLGAYKLVRAWQDMVPGRTVVYTWGSYALPGDDGSAVALGVSPILDVHDAEMCHLARGEDPVFHGQTNARSGAGTVNLKVATYNNGAVQWLEGSTVCDAGACREFAKDAKHVSLFYAGSHFRMPLAQGGAGGTRPVPVLLRVESTDVLTPDAVERPLLLARMQAFLQVFDLAQVTKPYAVTPAAH